MKKNLLLTAAFTLALFCFTNILKATNPPNGNCGKVIEFKKDDNSNAVVSGKSFKIDGQYTISGWFKTDIKISQCLVFIHREFWITQEAFNVRINAEGKLSVLHNSSGSVSLTSTSVVNNNQWHHYSVVKTADSLFLYVNGIKEARAYSNRYINNLIVTVLNLGLHKDWDEYEGWMDDFSIFKRALSSEEIQDLMQNQLQGNEANLLLYYDFNEYEEDVTFFDKSVNKINAGFNGNVIVRRLAEGVTCNKDYIFPPTTDCGTVVKLDGKDDHIVTNFGGGIFYGRSFTIESWVYLDDYNPGEASVIASTRVGNEGLMFYVGGDGAGGRKGRLCFDIGEPGVNFSKHNGNLMLELGKWYHVAAVYDFKNNSSSNHVRLYVNGNLEASFTNAAIVKNDFINTIPSGELIIGFEKRTVSPTSFYFNGMFDDFRVWQSARNATDILNNMNTSLTEHQTNLLLSFNFNEADNSNFVTDINDMATPENNFFGTLTNFDISNAWFKNDGVTKSNSSFTNIDIVACENYTTITDLVFNKSSTYVLNLLNSNGCDSTVKINLTIQTKTRNDVRYLGSTNSLQAIYPLDDAIYEWFNCDRPELGVVANTRTFTPTVSGNYKVKITRGVCIAESICTSITVVPNSSFNINVETISVFPNPTKGFVTVDFGSYYSDIFVKVYSLSGVLISQNYFGYANQFTTDLIGTPGLYILEIQPEGYSPAYLKVVKN